MDENDLKRILARNPAITYTDNSGRAIDPLSGKAGYLRQVPSKEPECREKDALVGVAKGEATSMGRPVVSIVFYRTRLVDPDGLNPKDLLDGLVKACLIRDDSEKDIELIPPTQVKVARKHEERTVIVINYV